MGFLQRWQLLKNNGEDFPDICPYAYAYVNWRKTLLKTERFYRSDIRSNDLARSGDDLDTSCLLMQ